MNRTTWMSFAAVIATVFCGGVNAENNPWKPYERLDFRTNVTVTVDHDWTMDHGVEMGPRAGVGGLTSKIVQKSGNVCFDRLKGAPQFFQPGGFGHKSATTTGIYELQGGTLTLTNGWMTLSSGNATGIFRQTGGRSELWAGYVFNTKNDRSRLELLGGEMVFHSLRYEGTEETWVVGDARIVFEGAPYVHRKYVAGGIVAPKSLELKGSAELCVAEDNELLLWTPISGTGKLVKTGKGALWLRKADYQAAGSIEVKEGRVNYLDEQSIPRLDGDFPLRIAQMHAKPHAKGVACRGADQFDVHFSDAGWPVRACDKYPASWVGMARLALALDNYDVVTVNTLWNHQLQGETVQMSVFAPYFKKFLERGGLLLGADVGSFGWLKTIDPLLAVGKASSRCTGPFRAANPGEQVVSFPNCNEGRVVFSHLTLPTNTLFRSVVDCHEGSNTATVVEAAYGKGRAILHNSWIAGPYGSLDETENYLVHHLIGDKLSIPDGKLFHDWRFPEFAPGERLSYTLPEIRNRTKKPVRMAMEHAIASVESDVPVVKSTTTVDFGPEQRKAPVVAVDSLPFGGKAVVTCRITVDGVKLPPKRKAVELPGTFTVHSPAFRGFIRADRDETRLISVDVNPIGVNLADCTVVLDVVGPGTNVAATVQVPAERGKMRIAVNPYNAAKQLHAFEPASIRATLKKGAVVLATSEAPVRVVPFRRNFHDADDWRVFRKDGEAYFPRGVYHTLQSDYKMLGDLGMNYVQQCPWWGDRPKEFLPMAEEAGFTGVWVEPMKFSNDESCGQMVLNELIGQYLDHPAMGWWYVYDEPHGEIANFRARRLYDILQSDIRHPSVVCCNKPQHCGFYSRMCDILALDCYPVRDGRFAQRPRVVGDFIDEALRATRGEVPVVMVLPCFGDDKDQGGLGHEQRWQQANMVCQCLVHGVSGIFWYANDFSKAKTDDEMMAGLRESCETIRELEPLLFNRATHRSDVSGDIHWLYGKDADGKNYLLAVNVAESEQSTVIDLPEHDGGRVSLTLPPCGVHKEIW
ncbi:MAG: hypothetical protein ACOX9C_05690 [Kiritimatiellia bacterium]|jgi:hypothetical protein